MWSNLLSLADVYPRRIPLQERNCHTTRLAKHMPLPNLHTLMGNMTGSTENFIALYLTSTACPSFQNDPRLHRSTLIRANHFTR